MKKEVVYIGELDQDVDDVIAAEYLHKKGALKAVVLDPMPKTPLGKERKRELEKLGIPVLNRMPQTTKYVFVGGALTELSRYVINHKVECLVMNGGFVGCNIVKKPLEKFKDKQVMRTFNFNCDAKATDLVLKSRHVEHIMLVGKNVCHDGRNTLNGVWKEERNLLEKYHAKPDKRQYDMLACREGLIFCGLLTEPSWLDYKEVYPYNVGLKGNMTQWGSKMEKTQYRQVLAAVGWKNDMESTRFTGVFQLSKEQVKDNPFITKDGSARFYNLIRGIFKSETHEIDEIDCRYISVAKNIWASWIEYAKENDIDIVGLSTQVCIFGPKVLEKLPDDTVEIQDGCFTFKPIETKPETGV